MSDPPTDRVDLRLNVTFTGFHMPQPQPQPQRTAIASDVPQIHMPERTTIASNEPRVHVPQRTAIVSDGLGIDKSLRLRHFALGKKRPLHPHGRRMEDIGESEDGIALTFSLGNGTLQTFDPSLASTETSSRIDQGHEEPSVDGQVRKEVNSGASKGANKTKKL